MRSCLESYWPVTGCNRPLARPVNDGTYSEAIVGIGKDAVATIRIPNEAKETLFLR
jgi:hypothetical protein